MSSRRVGAANALVLVAGLLALGAGAAGAGSSGDDPRPVVAVAEQPGAVQAPAPVPPPAAPSATPTAVPAPSPSSSPAAAPTASSAAPAPTTAAPRPRRARTTVRTGFAPYARVGPLVLHAPADVVEVIGFHQSGHDGAQPQQPVEALAVRAGLLEPRGRDTHRTGAADVVVDPAGEVRSPVTGTVVRASRYTLYCRHVDEYLVVEPDGRPGWEVKVLHVRGLSAVPGQRVEAGRTVVAAGARQLPFASQIDAFTGEPAWPHVHVEVVDTSVPDRPGTGGGC